MGGAAGAIERDNNGEADCDFGGSDSDDKEDEHLRVVIGQAIVAETKTRKGDKGKIGRVQHQLERHENDDDIAPQQDAAETDGRDKNQHRNYLERQVVVSKQY